MTKTYDVVGIGNAIIDILSSEADDFLNAEGIAKGGMTLIDAGRAKDLYGRMGPGIETSGGSAANTIAGSAGLGARCGFIGRVHDDQLGAVYIHDIKTMGIDFPNPPSKDGLPTAICLIIVTPDGQRSMNTFLGASTQLGVADLDEAMIAGAAITYMEGYLFDKAPAKEAFAKAMGIAKANQGKVALTLSDSFCVDMHRPDFRRLVEGDVDILFANEDEIKSLYEVDDFDKAVSAVRGQADIIALTRSSKGAVILVGDEMIEIAAQPVERVVDTTGAGDQFAAGMLAGLSQGLHAREAGIMGAVAAAEVIGHMGPRPRADVKVLVKAALGH